MLSITDDKLQGWMESNLLVFILYQSISSKHPHLQRVVLHTCLHQISELQASAVCGHNLVMFAAAMDAIAASTLRPLSLSSSMLPASPCTGRLGVGFSDFKLPLAVLGSSRRNNVGGVTCELAPDPQDRQVLPRRELISQALLAMSFTLSLPSQAATEVDTGAEFKVYEDPIEKFSLMVPQDWSKGEGRASGQRKVTAFFPANDNFTNVNVVITALGADYTGLGSFGSVDNFGENLVNSLDRSWQKPPGQKARLLTARSKGGMYFVEYTLQKPGEKQRHLVSVVGIGSNGWINRLFTVTGQFYEDDADKYKPNLQKVISSFKLS